MKSLLRVFGMSPDQQNATIYAWILRFLYQSGIVVVWTLLIALFVEKFGVHQLVWFFLYDALLMMLGTSAVVFLFARIQRKVFFYVLLASTFAAFSFAYFLGTDSLGFFVGALAAKSLFYSHINIALHRESESLFSPKQARTVMPKVESAITIATIVASAGTLLLLERFAPQDVLWLWMAVVVAIAVLIGLRDRLLHIVPTLHQMTVKAIHQRVGSPMREIVNGLRDIPYFRYLALLLFAQSFLVLGIELEFVQDLNLHMKPHVDLPPELLQASLLSDVQNAAQHVSDGAQNLFHTVQSHLVANNSLAHDLTLFHLMFGVIAFFVQVVLTPFIVGKLGVVRSQSLHIFTLIGATIARIFGLCSPTILRTFQHSSHSVGEAPYHLSFYSFPRMGRESIRLLLEGIMKPLGAAMACGVIFFFPISTVMSIGAGLLAMLFFFDPVAREAFTNISLWSTEKDRYIPLRHRVHHIEVLAQPGHSHALKTLLQLAEDRNEPEVIRLKAIETLAIRKESDAIQSFLQILSRTKESREVMAAVLDALKGMKQTADFWRENAWSYHQLEAVLQGLLKYPDEHLQKLAVMNLFEHLPTGKVVPFFIENMSNASERVQSIYLRSCRIFADPAIVPYLHSYLSHQNPTISGHAIIALWRVYDTTELRTKIQQLLDQNTPDALRAGLYAIGEVQDTSFVPQMHHLLVHPNRLVRLHAAIALGKIGSHDSDKTLEHILFSEDKHLSLIAWRMMKRLPEEMQARIQYRVQTRVCRMVQHVFQSVSHDLNALSGDILFELKHLYRLAEKHDDLALVDSLLRKNEIKSLQGANDAIIEE